MHPPPEQSDKPDVRQDRIRELIEQLVATEAEFQALTDGQADAILDPSLTGLYLILFNRRSPFQKFFIFLTG
jgi:ABC-type amino acid transport substrate-binding protein